MIHSANNNKRLSLQTSNSTSGAFRKKRNNKNLSLCISPDTTLFVNTTSEPLLLKRNSLFLADDNNNRNNLNAYPSGPIKIMENLYLGNEKNTMDLDYLKNQLSIQAILNVAAEVHHPYYQEENDDIVTPSPSLSKSSFASNSTTASTIQTIPDFTYQKLPWDHHQENLAVELTKAIDIIDRARNANQPILVHCQCGIARSATVIIAYVMKTMHMSTQDAYHYVKHIVPVINPNLSLLFQLREFEQTLMTAKKPSPQGFLARTSSFKRKLSKTIFQTSSGSGSNNNDSWWKTKKLDTKPTTTTTTDVCY